MKVRTGRDVRDLLTDERRHGSIVFYIGARDCREVPAAAIREAVRELRRRRGWAPEVAVLVEALSLNDPDMLLEAWWRVAIDILRALFRASPSGTERERQRLVTIARYTRIVEAMARVAALIEKVPPNWLAVLSAGSRVELQQVVRPDDLLPLPVLPGEELTHTRFWEVIDAAKDTLDPTNTVGRWLSRMHPDRVVAFDRHFTAAMELAFRYDVWDAIWFLQGGCSDDGFCDFRAALVLAGSTAFHAILEDPDSLADYTDVSGDELIVGLAASVYWELTGRDIPERDRDERLHPVGESIGKDEAALRRRFPRLAAVKRH